MQDKNKGWINAAYTEAYKNLLALEVWTHQATADTLSILVLVEMLCLHWEL